MPAVELPHPRPPIPGPIGRLFSLAYGAAVARRNRRFDARRGVVQFDRPVISVGNLSVGGTGKTPMVRHIVRLLQDAGHRPAIAMRGYGATARGQSDEAMEYGAALPGVPIVARANRTLGLIQMFATPVGEAVDVIVLDDGFQHRQIARQLDLVLVDASRSPFSEGLLPAGWLREPVRSLRRATAVVLTHAELVDAPTLSAIDARLAEPAVHGRTSIAVVSHGWTDLIAAGVGPQEPRPVSWLARRRVVAACAIGNPAGFLHQARKYIGVPPVAEIVLRDHDPFGPGAVARLVGTARRERAEAILVTEKDWAKLRRVPAQTWPCPIIRPKLQLRFDRGEAELAGAVLKAAALVPE